MRAYGIRAQNPRRRRVQRKSASVVEATAPGSRGAGETAMIETLPLGLWLVFAFPKTTSGKNFRHEEDNARRSRPLGRFLRAGLRAGRAADPRVAVRQPGRYRRRRDRDPGLPRRGAAFGCC